MKSLFNCLLFGVVLVSFNSCCTKEGCVPIVNTPSIYFVFSDYDYYELDEVKYFRLNATNKSVIDSLDNSERNDETLTLIGDYKAYYSTVFEDALELDKYNFVIKTTSRKDTIYNIDFSTSTYKAKCHSCFLANGKEEFIEIQNFSFYHKGIQYFDNDTIKIIK